MFDNTQDTAQPVKLRASCDECGVGKVKCDRKHPKCGRCISHGTVCVYGVSRKIGKPPRKRVRSRSRDGDDARKEDDAQKSGTTVSTSSLPANNPLAPWNTADGFPNSMDDFWDPLKDNGHDFATNNRNQSHNKNRTSTQDDQNKSGTMFDLDNFLSDSYSSLRGSSMPNFNSLGFDGWKDKVQYNMLPFAPSDTTTKDSVARDPATSERPTWTQAETRGRSPSSTKDHDCYREAHELLKHSSKATGSKTDLMAWDYLLHLNRETSEQLRGLLGCSCAGSPYLLMLYATLISAVLTRYQHALGDTIRTPSNPSTPQSTPSTGDTDGSASRSVGSGRSTAAPSKIVIGTFSVDDQRVQDALKIQLLASEVRRTAQLMDQFASFDFDSRKSEGQFNGNDISGLHQSLNLWLQGEYSKISHMIKNKLVELST